MNLISKSFVVAANSRLVIIVVKDFYFDDAEYLVQRHTYNVKNNLGHITDTLKVPSYQLKSWD
jgi:hypothetical protein